MNKYLIILLSVMIFIFSCTPGNTDNTSVVKKKIIEKKVVEVPKVTPVYWHIYHFKNDFGEPSKDKYIQAEDLNGKFSNSATYNSECPVHFIVTNFNIGIFLHEYGGMKAAYFIGDGIMLMKNSKGEKLKVDINGKWSHTGGLRISYNQIGVTNFLKRSVGFVKVVIRDDNSSEYHFKINANGFTKAYKSIDK